MTTEIWRDALERFAKQGTASEQLMAKMLLDLLVLPSAGPIIDGWALRILDP